MKVGEEGPIALGSTSRPDIRLSVPRVTPDARCHVHVRPVSLRRLRPNTPANRRSRLARVSFLACGVGVGQRFPMDCGGRAVIALPQQHVYAPEHSGMHRICEQFAVRPRLNHAPDRDFARSLILLPPASDSLPRNAPSFPSSMDLFFVPPEDFSWTFAVFATERRRDVTGAGKLSPSRRAIIGSPPS